MPECTTFSELLVPLIFVAKGACHSPVESYQNSRAKPLSVSKFPQEARAVGYIVTSGDQDRILPQADTVS